MVLFLTVGVRDIVPTQECHQPFPGWWPPLLTATLNTMRERGPHGPKRDCQLPPFSSHSGFARKLAWGISPCPLCRKDIYTYNARLKSNDRAYRLTWTVMTVVILKAPLVMWETFLAWYQKHEMWGTSAELFQREPTPLRFLSRVSPLSASFLPRAWLDKSALHGRGNVAGKTTPFFQPVRKYPNTTLHGQQRQDKRWYRPSNELGRVCHQPLHEVVVG